jgi:hypothetical protein
MTRDEIAKADFEAIWDWCSRFARDALSDYGELYPFAANVNLYGELIPFAVDMQQKVPRANDVIDLLVTAAKNEARDERIRAFGICFDATVNLPGSKERTDAIVCRLEHRDGDPLEIVLPYTMQDGWLECGEMHAGPGRARVFLDDDLQ